jgi:hypothetical protein
MVHFSGVHDDLNLAALVGVAPVAVACGRR